MKQTTAEKYMNLDFMFLGAVIRENSGLRSHGLQEEQGQRGAVADLHLPRDVVDVGLDRGLADEEAVGDRPVGQSQGDVVQHLELPVNSGTRRSPAGRREPRTPAPLDPVCSAREKIRSKTLQNVVTVFSTLAR